MEKVFEHKTGTTIVSIDYFKESDLTNLKISFLFNEVRMIHVEPLMLGRFNGMKLDISPSNLCRILAHSIEAMKKHLLGQGPDNPEKTPAAYDKNFVQAKKQDSELFLKFIDEWKNHEYDIPKVCETLDHPILAMRGECLCGKYAGGKIVKNESKITGGCFPDDETIEKFPELSESEATHFVTDTGEIFEPPEDKEES